MNEVMLSVCVPVYNHENYIQKALDSIYLQETKFSFEVLVGEDCSTDNSREILKQYEAKHNYNNLFVFYRDHNMHSSKINNIMDLKFRSKGKYIIVLEGDDFWIDKNKIEEQIDFLESHDTYIAVCHNCVVVDEQSIPNGEKYPECKHEEYTLEHFANLIMPGQTATVMYRNIYNRTSTVNMSLIEHKSPIGDRKLYFTLVTNGKVKCIQKTMSAYRHVVNKGSSFSAQHKGFEFELTLDLAIAYLNYAQLLNEKKAILASELLYIRCLRGGFRKKKISFGDICKHFKKFRFKHIIVRDLIVADIINLVFGSNQRPTIL